MVGLSYVTDDCAAESRERSDDRAAGQLGRLSVVLELHLSSLLWYSTA
jgi:hypothetical protein